MGETTTILILLRSLSDEHVPDVCGELLSDSERTPCEVTEIERNHKYTLKFTPTMRGKHQLHIKVDNKHVVNSPYSITVWPSVDSLGTHVRTISEHRVIGERSGLAVNRNGEIILRC